MANRLRLLQAMTALLYLGPLLAGLAGQGWPAVALFSAIFVLWSVILRPHLWPATAADLAQSEALVALAALIASQILLVALCVAIGAGIGGVMGFHPGLPAALPAVISFLSVPLCRMVWNPHTNDALAGVDPLTHAPISGPSAPSEAATLPDRLMAQVMALPADADEADLQAHITAISAHIDALQIRRTLEDAAQAHQITRAGLKALIVHATDPDVALVLSGSAWPASAFALAGQEDDLLTLFATRCTRVVEDDVTLAADCPDPTALIAAALRAGPEARDALLRLAGLLHQGQLAES